MIDQKRMRILKKGTKKDGPIIYWMSRDQRVSDNWALLYAQELAKKNNQPFAVVFCLVPTFLGATLRQYDFMLKGLQGVEQELNRYHIPFFMISGNPSTKIPSFIKKHNIATLITDFSPLKISRKWKNEITKKIEIPFYEVDTHNIVPCWIASAKQEYAARTFRPKIHKKLKEFLTSFPRVIRQKKQWPKTKSTSWDLLYKKIQVNTHVKPVSWLKPGEKAAKRQLQAFINKKLDGYAEKRNDPTIQGQSNLSPYLHFGHLAAQRIALSIIKTKKGQPNDRNAFLEELIIRKELSDNYCFYNKQYDTPKGFPTWALKTLNKHNKNKRAYTYSTKQFETAKTHDDLWNAAQKEMMRTGKMHGYLRMYWAKKILEWSKNYKTAFSIALALNDKYELDGRDPNGYVGVAWSIGGVHDRPWAPRPIFGTIRYMSYDGCRKKFDVAAYIQTNR